MTRTRQNTYRRTIPAHIPTDKNTVDFFGKLVNAARYRMSVYYNMGRKIWHLFLASYRLKRLESMTTIIVVP
jgi:hypothetical protein